jgi:hypothetical protein
MKPTLSSAQIKKLITALNPEDQQLIMDKINNPNTDYSFAKAYGLDRKNLTPAEIEIAFGQAI